MRDATLQGALMVPLQRDPSGRCIAFASERGSHSWASREEFFGRAAGIARVLVDHGLAAGDRCVIALPSDELAATTVIGALLVGALPLLASPPLIPNAQAGRVEVIKDVVGRAGARIVVVESSLDPSVREAARRVNAAVVTEHALNACEACPVESVTTTPDAPVAMQLTSGTTGSPRICTWTQSHLMAAIDGMATAMKLDEDDIFVNWTPLYHDMGLVNNFLLCMAIGAPIVMLKPTDFVRRPHSWLRAIHDARATTTWSPNFGFALAAARVSEPEVAELDLTCVRGFWNAAERVHASTMDAFARRFAPAGVTRSMLKASFGCAENIGSATFTGLDDPYTVEYVDGDRLRKQGIAETVDPAGDTAIAIVGCGYPHPRVELGVLAEDGRALDEGHVGRLALKSASAMDGYLDDEAATNAAVIGDWLTTGDLAYLRQGQLFWVGRFAERINIHGQKVDPSDFEACLLSVEGLRMGCFAAFGVDDPVTGTQRLVIAVEVREPMTRPLVEIEAEVRSRVMTEFSLPIHDLLILPERSMEKTSSGKRRHRHYREQYQAGRLSGLA